MNSTTQNRKIRNTRKGNLSPFKVGTIFSPIDFTPTRIMPVCKSIKIKFPARLNAMAIDPSKIAISKNHVYTPGEVVFSIGTYRSATASLRNDDKLVITGNSAKHSLIKHSFLIMKRALRLTKGLNIEIFDAADCRHCGLGSSSGLIATVACAINELYGNPIDDLLLIKYLAQNHGEEIDGTNDYLYPVQCIGGSAASGICNQGLIILAGESRVIATMKIPSEFKVIIGIPKDFHDIDSKAQLDQEVKNMKKFVETGRKYGKQIAYNVLHIMLPAVSQGNLRKIGDVIYDYRYRMGSIKNCAYAYPHLPKICDRLSFLKRRNIAEVLSISSVGPAVFAISKNVDLCTTAFEREDLKTMVTTIDNARYRVLERINV